MPLAQGSSKKTISKNISEFHTGKTYAHTSEKFGKERADKQAVAVALDVARRNRAMGGPLARIGQQPWFVKQEARNLTHTGPIMSAVPGRTDAHAMNVPSGSYVVPAQAVSHLGQNNTLAGMNVLSKMFGPGGPYGTSAPSIMRGRSMPGIPKMPHAALMKPPRLSDKGGARGEGMGQPVPINAAGGEFIIPPEVVMKIGGGNLNHGHKILDNWIMQIKKEHAETIKKLPGPAKN